MSDDAINPEDEVELQTTCETEVVIPELPVEVFATEEEIAAQKATNDYILVRKNALAIAETLVHHGKCMTELEEANAQLRLEIAQLRQELGMQKDMIVNSLKQKYGTGPTA